MKPVLPDGMVAIVKRDCPTCALIVPVLGQIRAAGKPLTIYTQDDSGFPPGLGPVDDTSLAVSGWIGPAGPMRSRAPITSRRATSGSGAVINRRTG